MLVMFGVFYAGSMWALYKAQPYLEARYGRKVVKGKRKAVQRKQAGQAVMHAAKLKKADLQQELVTDPPINFEKHVTVLEEMRVKKSNGGAAHDGEES